MRSENGAAIQACETELRECGDDPEKRAELNLQRSKLLARGSRLKMLEKTLRMGAEIGEYVGDGTNPLLLLSKLHETLKAIVAVIDAEDGSKTRIVLKAAQAYLEQHGICV